MRPQRRRRQADVRRRQNEAAPGRAVMAGMPQVRPQRRRRQADVRRRQSEAAEAQQHGWHAAAAAGAWRAHQADVRRQQWSCSTAGMPAHGIGGCVARFLLRIGAQTAAPSRRSPSLAAMSRWPAQLRGVLLAPAAAARSWSACSHLTASRCCAPESDQRCRLPLLGMPPVLWGAQCVFALALPVWYWSQQVDQDWQLATSRVCQATVGCCRYQTTLLDKQAGQPFAKGSRQACRTNTRSCALVSCIGLYSR
jgi:hypothetical protein